jgi:hypothetical protein
MKLEIIELEKEMLMAMGTDFHGFCLAHNMKKNNVIVCPECPVYNLCSMIDRNIAVADWLAKNAEVIDKKEYLR